MRYCIANWKANKTESEAIDWLNVFFALIREDVSVLKKLNENAVSIVICPQAPLLSSLYHYTTKLPHIFLGAQTISSKERGSYTGEVTAESVKQYVRFVLIGHSERRRFFSETDEDIEQKYRILIQNSLLPILCIQSKENKIPENSPFIAYEPVAAIGTGNNESVEKVIQIKESLSLSEKTAFLYGGSVTEANAHMYLQETRIDGLLIGGASLDPHSFYSIVKQF